MVGTIPGFTLRTQRISSAGRAFGLSEWSLVRKPQKKKKDALKEAIELELCDRATIDRIHELLNS